MAWSTDVETDGLRLHVTRTGSGAAPPLVLAHGVGDDGPCWTTLADALADDYDVVMVDARGHGRSEGPEEGGYSPAEQAGDLAGVISALGLDRPVVVGHSMGALTAMVLAAERPGAARAIVLEDPPPTWRGAGPDEARDGYRDAQRSLRELKRRTYDELVAEQGAVSPAWPDGEVARWARAKQRCDPSVVERFGSVLGPEVDWRGTVRQIGCPVLLVTGDPSLEALVTDDDATTLRELVPQLRAAHIPGAGHSIRRDRFDSYLKIVRGFLDGLGAPA